MTRRAVVPLLVLLLAAVALPARAAESVTVTYPTAGQVVTGTIRVDARAPGASRVTYLLDGKRVAQDRTCCDWAEDWDSRTTPDGEHTLVAQATTPAGVTTSAAVRFAVANKPKPTPAPAPAPPQDPPPRPADRGPSGQTLIWAEDFSTGINCNIWRRVQNGAYSDTCPGYRGAYPLTVVDGAARFEQRPGDRAANGERTELSGDGARWQFREGDERWLQFRFKVDPDFKPGTAGRFYIIAQLHAAAGSPPLAVGIRGDGALKLTGDTVIIPGPEFLAARGRWLDIDLHWINSNSETRGGAEVYVDGVLRLPWHARQTMSSDRNYLKMGQYRHPSTTTNVTWLDDVRLTAP